MATVVHSQHLVTILGSGQASAEDIEEILTRAPVLVAADGGADRARALGHRPAAVIGDFDSVSSETLFDLPDTAKHRIAEQETTDFEKCLTRIAAPLVLAIGVTGPRLDHTLAVLSVLARVQNPRCVVIGDADILFAAPRDIALDLSAGTRLSLFPMRPVTGTSQGLRWPIDGIAFAPDKAIGTSNEVTGPVRLTFDDPGMLVILPRSALDHVIDVLRGL